MIDNDLCPICDMTTEESVQHFLLECPAYVSIRGKFLLELDTLLRGCSDVCFSELPPVDQLQFVIGDVGFLFSEDIGNEIDLLSKVFLNDLIQTRIDLINK